MVMLKNQHIKAFGVSNKVSIARLGSCWGELWPYLKPYGRNGDCDNPRWGPAEAIRLVFKAL
jgi:hypothetical protein